MSKLRAFNLQGWIEENRHLLKPPVGNKCVYRDGHFIVMIVGGPNERTDFHVNRTEEFFYQLEGDITLRVINEEGEMEDLPIREGEVFMLPGGVPHSPQRSAGSVGLVIEKARVEGEDVDGLQWYCFKCHHKLYEERFFLSDIEEQFGAVSERYYQSEHTTCKRCGHQNGKEWR